MQEHNDRPDGELEVDAAALDEATVEDAEPTEKPRFIDRTPWKYVVPITLLLVVWLLIGLVCSPRYFRF